MNNPVFALTADQLILFGRLEHDDQNEITNKIDSINRIRTITSADIEDDVRYSYILRRNLNQNTHLPLNFNNTVEAVKLELIQENTNDINNILNGALPGLRRVAGGDRGVLIDRVLLTLLNDRVVGGKRRKTSNKKVSARRRRSSKRRMSKAHNARTTRRKY